jgi:hypothetical protein
MSIIRYRFYLTISWAQTAIIEIKKPLRGGFLISSDFPSNRDKESEWKSSEPEGIRLEIVVHNINR